MPSSCGRLIELRVLAGTQAEPIHVPFDPSLLDAMTERVPLEACVSVADRLIAGAVRGRVIVPISNEQ